MRVLELHAIDLIPNKKGIVTAHMPRSAIKASLSHLDRLLRSLPGIFRACSF